MMIRGESKLKQGLIGMVLVALLISVASVAFVSAQPNEPVEKIVFIHHVKSVTVPASTDQVTNYKVLYGGVKWRSLPVTYSVNPTGSGLANNDDVRDQVQSAFEAWDAVTGKELFNSAILDLTVSYGRNNKNTVTWSYISDSRIIAQTTIWFNLLTKTVVECDIVFSTNTAIPWGIDPDGEGGITIVAFDVRNIATHESGHWLVLLDLYASKDSELTMYGYSAKGETKKISLGLGDIRGCQKLYGA